MQKFNLEDVFGRYIDGTRTFESLDEARTGTPDAGDVVLVRDLSRIVPKEVWTAQPERGKWHLRSYRLGGHGLAGNLLMVDDRAEHDGKRAVPPELEIPLDLPGWYAIWIGVPALELSRGRILSGLDAALDGEPGYTQLSPDTGIRYGRSMRPVNVEVSCFWKCARLDGRTLRLRIPWGVPSSFPWGLVRGGISSLRLVKLTDEQIAAYQSDIADPSTKRIGVMHDGCSHYHCWGEPGNKVDVQFVQQYRDSDVRMLIYQTPSTGVASWPSRVTTIAGEDVTEEQWKNLRLGDRRITDYIRWAIDNQQEGIGVVSSACREAGIECHAGLRMNLFFQQPGGDGAIENLLNGRFWCEHPELRKPGGKQLDYALPEVRRFVLSLLMELAENYDVSGLSLDFTRWPPIADPERHDFDVLTSFVREVRQSLDVLSEKKGRKMALSAQMVEGYHARRKGRLMTLSDQKIDLEAWLAEGLLDFVCVQAWDQRKYLAIAQKYDVPYYTLVDNGSIGPLGLDDPEWMQDARPDEDPLAGEELEKEPHVGSTMDPGEWDRTVLEHAPPGAAGVMVCNASGLFIRRLGHVDEMAERIEKGLVWGQELGPKIYLQDLLREDLKK